MIHNVYSIDIIETSYESNYGYVYHNIFLFFYFEMYYISVKIKGITNLQWKI